MLSLQELSDSFPLLRRRGKADDAGEGAVLMHAEEADDSEDVAEEGQSGVAVVAVGGARVVVVVPVHDGRVSGPQAEADV